MRKVREGMNCLLTQHAMKTVNVLLLMENFKEDVWKQSIENCG